MKIPVSPHILNLPSPQMIAAAIAHRACGLSEDDPAKGKIAGYCVICNCLWPCQTAEQFLFEPSQAVPPEQTA